MNWPLYWRLPPKGEVTNERILDQFLDYIFSKNLTLYAAQEEAILDLLDQKNVILNTPTGSGKSLVALALHFESLARGRRSVYTCPIKALVNEKFRALCADFGPDQVGMLTGDGGVNIKAPILCCTAEILSNQALREGALAPIDDVIMDEFHYYSDKQRGVAWQVPLLQLPQARFLLMSATLGEMDFFSKALTRLNSRETTLVQSDQRPVPLHFEYSETPLHETVSRLVAEKQAPIYLVNFSQREAAEEAQNLLSVDFCTKEEKRKIHEAIQETSFESPYGSEIKKLLRHGVGLHHAGLLPKYRVLVERLAQQGLLKVISGTDTLGVGVNVPIRTVLFTRLCKFDGDKTSLLSVRDFRQISGRAGRRGYDDEGRVVVQAPAHVIENLRQKLKAEGDTKKLRKLVMKTPPPHFVMWTKETFQKLLSSSPEPLVSRFDVSHGMLLNVLSRGAQGCEALRGLIHECHEDIRSKRRLRKKAFKLFRSLLDRKIVEYTQPIEPGEKPGLRVNIALQDDFSLNQTLALYLVDTIEKLDSQSPEYHLDLLTLVESILESPDLILKRQLDRLKTEKMAEMKAAGMEYEERMEELEKLEPPKPNRDFIYSTFNVFADAHPWIGEENIRPKSIAREMFENFYSFAEYIREYDLQRVEGLLLRYLTDVFKVLQQTVPDYAKTEEVGAIAVFFKTMIDGVDSSLFEEWERLKDPSGLLTSARLSKENSIADANVVHDITQDHRAFTLLIRNEVFRLVRCFSIKDYSQALNHLLSNRGEDGEWTAAELEHSMALFYQDHSQIRSDPGARSPSFTSFSKTKEHWDLTQILVDPEEANDWALNIRIPLKDSAQVERPLLQLLSIGPIGG